MGTFNNLSIAKKSTIGLNPVTKLPFPFTAIGMEYVFKATHYSKLHIPTKIVRNIPLEFPPVTRLQRRQYRAA
jgi:hypothetical protein